MRVEQVEITTTDQIEGQHRAKAALPWACYVLRVGNDDQSIVFRGYESSSDWPVSAVTAYCGVCGWHSYEDVTETNGECPDC